MIMIPFHIIYSWLFKSFNIGWETTLIDRLTSEWYTRIMIVKRSWIFALFVLWIPLMILLLSWVSIWIALYSIELPIIRYTIISGNILMSVIFIISSWNYIRHFREIQSASTISEDLATLREKLQRWDAYFVSFFNASITNQYILFLTIIGEIILIFLYQKTLWDHFWILATDTLVMIMEIVFLKMFRKRMIDLEMDYNIIVPGKVFFVNQSGVLSSIQTIESDKIKTVRSSFPSKLASFFDYGTVDILTEWDSQAMLGTMSMYYVTDPDEVVASIQSLLDTPLGERITRKDNVTPPEKTWPIQYESSSKVHARDISGKIRDVLE